MLLCVPGSNRPGAQHRGFWWVGARGTGSTCPQGPRALLFSQDLFLPALGTSEHNCFREELGVLPARIRSSALTRQKRHSHQESPAPGCALFRNCDCVYLKPRLSNCHLIFKRKRRKIFLGVSVWGSGARIPFHHPAGSVWRSPHCFPLDTPSYF
jgi:hypothetical protein